MLIAEQRSKRIQAHLVIAALLAGGAGHVGDGAPGVNDQRELLRGRPDVQPRRIVPEPEQQRAPSSAPQIQHSVGKKIGEKPRA